MNESIIVTDLCKQYRDVRALDGVSLTVHRGELFGLLGVNGAGKTTLIKILSGLVSKTSGNATVEGLEVPRDMEAIKALVSVSPQETAIAPNLTVMENLRFFAAIYGKTDEEHLQQIIRMFYLEEIEALCDRVAILASGHLLTCGTVAQIKAATGRESFEDAFVAVVEKGVSAS